MKSTAIILALIGCLIQCPHLYQIYLNCRAGLPNGIPHHGGNDPRSIELGESHWRYRQTSPKTDPAIWNSHKDTPAAIHGFEEGMTRDEVIEMKWITSDNPIRPLSENERTRMKSDLLQWSYYNDALGMYYLGPITWALLVLPWLVVVLGFSIYWIMHRQFLPIVLSLGVPFIFLAVLGKLIKSVV